MKSKIFRKQIFSTAIWAITALILCTNLCAIENSKAGEVEAKKADSSERKSINLPVFLAGQWCGGDLTQSEEETWSLPRGKVMLGMHRDVRKGALTGFEFLRIVANTTSVQLHAQPQGQSATIFTASQQTPDYILFENKNNDYPKRISYRRLNATTLIAQIDRGGDDKSPMQWRWSNQCDWLKSF